MLWLHNCRSCWDDQTWYSEFFHLRSFSVSFEQVWPSQIWSNKKNTLTLVLWTLNEFKLKSFEYQVCSAHQDLQYLYIPFFLLRKFEQNVVQISQVCDIASESLYEIQEFVTSVWYNFFKWENELCKNCRSF